MFDVVVLTAVLFSASASSPISERSFDRIRIATLPPVTEAVVNQTHILFCNLVAGFALSNDDSKRLAFEWTRNGQSLSKKQNNHHHNHNKNIFIESQPAFSMLKFDPVLAGDSAVYGCNVVLVQQHSSKISVGDSTSTKLVVQVFIIII
ncbi:hypothetical protein TYRP_004121 [Tyrophagus putrescentiae]|nr:hypothetical protein TYRP_004121 [Tyrophagus putrescentiae]